MSFQSDIIERVKLNATHAKYCEDCFDTTSSMYFWIWDPLDAPEIPYSQEEDPERNYAQLLFIPSARQRRESLEVICLSEKERTFIALDRCLISDRNKCEGLIFQGVEKPGIIIWIELKMNIKRKNPNPKTLEDRIIGEEGEDKKNAFDQIISAMNFFEEKGIDISICQNKWHIAIPKDMKIYAAKSNAIQARMTKERKLHKNKKLRITIGPTLTLD